MSYASEGHDRELGAFAFCLGVTGSALIANVPHQQAHCEDHGGSLATIASAADTELATDALAKRFHTHSEKPVVGNLNTFQQPNPHAAWIGLYRVTYREGGVFRWLSGPGAAGEGAYTDWGPHQPDDCQGTHGQGQNCVEVHLDGGW